MISSIQNQHRLVKENGMEYYTIDGIKTIQSEMMRLLNIIDQIARENKISYWIAGGSMIGVVRHHGFIPWDDDLDIELLKSDYIKLIQCLTDYCKSHEEEYLFYQAPQHYHCCNYFASKNLFLRCQGSAHVYPVKVDIRPFNCIKNTQAEIDQNNKLKDIANYKVFGVSHGYVSVKDAKSYNTGKFFEHYNYEYGTYDPEQNDSLLEPPYYEYSVDFNFQYKHLFPLRQEQFENILVPLPKDYDYILSSVYGDYMQLPQLHHRAPAACEMIKKEIPLNVLMKFYSSEPDSAFARRLKRILFLVRFHGLRKFIKYSLEKRVVIGTNYEESKGNW